MLLVRHCIGGTKPSASTCSLNGKSDSVKGATDADDTGCQTCDRGVAAVVPTAVTLGVRNLNRRWNLQLNEMEVQRMTAFAHEAVTGG
jgi:hypothetical protein